MSSSKKSNRAAVYNIDKVDDVPGFAGTVNCLGHCGKPFHSPDRRSWRMCPDCRRRGPDALGGPLKKGSIRLTVDANGARAKTRIRKGAPRPQKPSKWIK